LGRWTYFFLVLVRVWRLHPWHKFLLMNGILVVHMDVDEDEDVDIDIGMDMEDSSWWNHRCSRALPSIAVRS